MKRIHVAIALLALIVCASSQKALAGPVGPTLINGQELIAMGGPVNIYFVGSSAAFESLLRLTFPTELGPFFPNHSTTPGTMISLGTFAPGTPLVFGLDVLSTGNRFYTGVGSRNADGLVHAGITQWEADSLIPVNGFLVGFEDVFRGGDMDFNDHMFVFEGVQPAAPVPEPGTIFLLTTGLIGVGGAVRRRL
jgi:PEP-CTERM motif